MGRNTFLSLPKGALPNRRNIVLSRSCSSFEGCDTYTSLDDAVSSCNENEEVFIIGGASVYNQAISIADRLYLTEVHDTPSEADTFFPEYEGWEEVRREDHPADDMPTAIHSLTTRDRLSTFPHISHHQRLQIRFLQHSQLPLHMEIVLSDVHVEGSLRLLLS